MVATRRLSFRWLTAPLLAPLAPLAAKAVASTQAVAQRVPPPLGTPDWAQRVWNHPYVTGAARVAMNGKDTRVITLHHVGDHVSGETITRLVVKATGARWLEHFHQIGRNSTSQVEVFGL